MLRKVLVSAVANAENNFAQDRKKLVVKEVLVTQATTLKRWLPIARGSAHPIRKRNSHITVVVGLSLDLPEVLSDQQKEVSVESPVQKSVVKKRVSKKAGVSKKTD